MKKTNKSIIATIASIVALMGLGGCAMTQKKVINKDKRVASSKKDYRWYKAISKNSSLI